MGDLTTKHLPEILALRDAQELAQASQPLDSTTIFVAEVERVRDEDAVSADQDSNTKLDATWDGAR